jgi:deoxycytidylate deaminase
MYVSCGVPCNQCLLLIIAAGLTRVYVENLNHYDKLTSLVLEHTHLKILLMED